MSKLVKLALLASTIFLTSSLVLADKPHREGKRPGQDGAGTKPRYLDKMESHAGDEGKEEIGGKGGEERKKTKLEDSKRPKSDPSEERRDNRRSPADKSGASEETTFTTAS